MFHHIRKFSSAVKASPMISVLYQKNNKMVRPRFLHEESKNPAAAAAGTLLDQISLTPFKLKNPAAAGTLLDQISLDQISLRSFQLTDVDDIMLWATDEQLIRYCGWEEIGIKGIYTSKEDALEDMKKNIIPHPWDRAICLKNQPIGKISVDSLDRFRAKISYVVASKHWGKGIATTAVKIVLDTIFKDLPNLKRLEANVFVENLASHRVLEKAGFLKEGVRRKYCIHNGRAVNAAIFSFLSTDFKSPLLD